MTNLVEKEISLFLYVFEMNFNVHSADYPMISDIEMNSFKTRMTDLSENEINSDVLYEPIMEGLVQSSLAHFLYFKMNKCEIDKPVFHPNYILFDYMDHLQEKNSSATLGAFRLYEIVPGTSSLDIDKLTAKIDGLLQNNVLKQMVYTFVKKLQVGDDQVEQIFSFVKNKRNRTKNTGLLYFILMDLYLEEIDVFKLDVIKKSGINFFWVRCLNTTIHGFSDKKAVTKLNKILKFSQILQAWV